MRTAEVTMNLLRACPYGLLSLALVAACTELGDEPAVGTDEQHSFASNTPRWPNRTITYVIDFDGSLGPELCHQSGDVVASGDAIDPNDTLPILLATERYNDLTPVRMNLGNENDLSDPDTLIFTKRIRGKSAHANTSGYPTRGSGEGEWGPNEHPCVFLAGDDVDGTYKPTSAEAMQHELGHTIGMPHTQKRPDAANYIAFDMSCVMPSNRDAFQTMAWSDGTIFEPYDYASMMHYASSSACCTPGDTEGGFTCPSSCQQNGACARLPMVKRCDGNNPLFVDDYTICSDIVIHDPGDFSPTDLNTIYRMYEKPLGGNSSGDRFGASLARGDFDGDGYLDLAIGTPREYIDGLRSGVVFLWRGTSDRLVAWKVLRSPTPEADGAFGAVLAAGDLDNNDRDELVVSATGEGTGGKVHVFRAESWEQLDGTGYIHENVAPWTTIQPQDVGRPQQADAEFGAALAIADFNESGINDLAIGAPGGSYSATGIRAGYVSILRGRAGATPVSWSSFTQAGMSALNAGERFGASLAATHVNPSGVVLAVGAPAVTVPATPGMVFVFDGSSTGMTGAHTLDRGIAGDHFGAALAFGGSTWNDSDTLRWLAVGAPEDGGTRGRVWIYKPTSLSQSFTLTYAQLVLQPSPLVGDRFGSVLASVRVSGNDFDTLVAGLPSRDLGGYVRYPTSAYGSTYPFQTAGTLIANPGSGARFGTAIATTGVYDALTGRKLEEKLVVGAEGTSGAGDIYVRDGSGWDRIDQATIHPGQ
jgi:hypothetical protein